MPQETFREWRQRTRPAPATAPLEDLTEFARQQGATVTSTNQGRHNPGSAHYEGRAIDLRTRDRLPAEVDQLMHEASAAGYQVRDERTRPSGQAVWSGPHLHLEAAAPVGDFTRWRQKQAQAKQPVHRTQIGPRLEEPVAPFDFRAPSLPGQQRLQSLIPNASAAKAKPTTPREPVRPAVENPFDYQTAGQMLRQDLQRRDEAVPTTPELRQRQQVVEGALDAIEKPLPGVEFVNQFLQSAGRGLVRIPQGLAELADLMAPAGAAGGPGTPGQMPHQPQTAQRRYQLPAAPDATGPLAPQLRPFTQQAEETVRRAVPVDPNDHDWVTAKIPAALGSTVPFAVGGLATRGSTAATALLGAASNAADIGAEFDAAGGDPAQRELAIAAAAAVGLTEVAGIGRLMAKFGANRGTVEVAKQVLEEGGQEGLQQWLNNLIASDVGGYDPNRPAAQDVAESAALGGIVGGAFGGASSAANKGRDSELMPL